MPALVIEVENGRVNSTARRHRDAGRAFAMATGLVAHRHYFSTSDLYKIISQLQAKGVEFKVIDEQQVTLSQIVDFFPCPSLS